VTGLRVGRGRLLPALMLAAALLLFAASLVRPEAEPPSGLSVLAARTVEAARRADAALASLAMGGGGVEPPPPSVVARLASRLAELEANVSGAGGWLGERLTRGIEAYRYTALSVYNVSKGYPSLRRGVPALARALDLLAACRVEEALEAYRSNRVAIEGAVGVLLDAEAEAAMVDPGAALFREHVAVLEAYSRDVAALARSAEAARGLLELVSRSPGLGEALCRGSPQAVARAASGLGLSPQLLASRVSVLSPTMGAKLAEAASILQAGHQKGGGQGAGRGGGGSDD